MMPLSIGILRSPGIEWIGIHEIEVADRSIRIVDPPFASQRARSAGASAIGTAMIRRASPWASPGWLCNCYPGRRLSYPGRRLMPGGHRHRKLPADQGSAARPGADLQRATECGHPIGHVLDSGAAASLRHVHPPAVVRDAEPEHATGFLEVDGQDRGPCVLHGILKGLEAAEVDSRLGLRRIA